MDYRRTTRSRSKKVIPRRANVSTYTRSDGFADGRVYLCYGGIESTLPPTSLLQFSSSVSTRVFVCGRTDPFPCNTHLFPGHRVEHNRPRGCKCYHYLYIL